VEPENPLTEFHPLVMPAAQQSVLRKIGPHAAAQRFYLAGGTAIAIHLGHRQSVDLDWFTADAIEQPLRIAEYLGQRGVPIEVSSVEKGTLHGSAESVKLSFLEYRYPSLRQPVPWPDFGCELASLEDLACMKLSAVSSRGAKKDFIDLYALGSTHFTLDQMLGFYQQKYETTDLLHVLSSLTYFDDAESEDTPVLLWPLEWSGVKRAVQEWVADYVHNQAPPSSQTR
jgi:hypothetical protein